MLERDFPNCKDEMCKEAFIYKENAKVILSSSKINKHKVAGKLCEELIKICSKYVFQIELFFLNAPVFTGMICLGMSVKAMQSTVHCIFNSL